MLDVFVEETRDGAIVALAEEIGFADGFVRKRRLKGRGRQSHTKSHEEASEESKGVAHHDNPKDKYSAEFRVTQ
jgi:hypothetical protein